VSARPQAFVNRISDALLLNLKSIGQSGTGQWLTRPKWVERGIAVDALNLPKPALFLMARGWGPSDPINLITGVLTGRAVGKWDVLCICDQPMTKREAEQELNNLASDVIAAVERDYQLGDLLPMGWVHAVQYMPEAELSGSTFSVASVELAGTWIWDTDNV
jgi:hypothetical protein